MKKNDKLQKLVGRTVRLKGKLQTARIKYIYSDIEGGVKLDQRLDGFWSWNIADLEVLPAEAPTNEISGPAKTEPRTLSGLDYDTRDMIVKQLAIIKQEVEGYRRHAFHAEWFMSGEAAKAILFQAGQKIRGVHGRKGRLVH